MKDIVITTKQRGAKVWEAMTLYNGFHMSCLGESKEEAQNILTHEIMEQEKEQQK